MSGWGYTTVLTGLLLALQIFLYLKHNTVNYLQLQAPGAVGLKCSKIIMCRIVQDVTKIKLRSNLDYVWITYWWEVPWLYIRNWKLFIQCFYLFIFNYIVATDLLLAWNPVCLGLVEGVIGKIQLHAGKSKSHSQKIIARLRIKYENKVFKFWLLYLLKVRSKHMLLFSPKFTEILLNRRLFPVIFAVIQFVTGRYRTRGS